MRLLVYITWIGAVVGRFLRGANDTAFPDIDGVWYQALTSRFITSTEQIDEKCLTWVVGSNDTHASVNVSSRMHSYYGDENINTYAYTKTRSDKNEFILQQNNVSDNTDLWIRESTPSYMFLMGLDNMTFFVLARDMNLFYSHQGMAIQQLREWDYIDGYKSPVLTYDVKC
jgi:hypothetical protein